MYFDGSPGDYLMLKSEATKSFEFVYSRIFEKNKENDQSIKHYRIYGHLLKHNTWCNFETSFDATIPFVKAFMSCWFFFWKNIELFISCDDRFILKFDSQNH